MRYSLTEKTVLVGQLEPSKTVNIKLINLSTDSLISITDSVCIESSHIPGLYMWDTSKIALNTITGFTNILYEMSQGTEVYYGKFIYGGYVDADGNVDLTGIITDLTEVLDTLNIINMRI